MAYTKKSPQKLILSDLKTYSRCRLVRTIGVESEIIRDCLVSGFFTVECRKTLHYLLSSGLKFAIY